MGSSHRRIVALFGAQFFGALVDNVLRSALAALVATRALHLGGLGPEALTALAAGLFVLPFVLFSGPAGALSDTFSKAAVLRAAKLIELPVVALAGYGLVAAHLPVLLVSLFLLGAQAALFGPAKYAILSDLVEPPALIGGTALIATGTFLAIVLGALVVDGAVDPTVIALIALALSLSGLIASRFIPTTPSGTPAARGPLVSLVESWRAARAVRSVFLSVLAISWFWFLGSALLALLPSFAAGGSMHRVLAVFCGGLALGSLAAGGLARGRIELGLVPLGSVGMTVGLVDLWWIGGEPVTGPALLDLGLVAVGSGLYTVPLYAMIQDRSAPAVRSRVIAANNVLNALFMVGSALLVYGMSAGGLAVGDQLLVLAVLNALVAIYIYRVIPEFVLRLVIWTLANLAYRLRARGLEHVPDKGPAVLVANHVTFVDWLFITAACRRPPRFVMYHGYFAMPVIGWFFRAGKVIPIAPAHESAETMQRAFDRIAAELEDGELVCLFPEGKLSKTGEMEPFRTGIERIIARTPVPVVPMALLGLWGSVFSRKRRSKVPRGFRSPIELRVGPPIPPEQVTAHGLAEVVAALGGFAAPRDAAS